jgi:hypothetical protein
LQKPVLEINTRTVYLSIPYLGDLNKSKLDVLRRAVITMRKMPPAPPVLFNGQMRDDELLTADNEGRERGESSRRFAILVDLRNRSAIAFSGLADFLECRPLLSFMLLMTVFVPSALGHSLNKLLWHDELFTFYIAQASTLSSLFRETRLVDLNPPLAYLLTRASFFLFGINTLTVRLPELAGFVLAMLSLFLFVRHRAGTLYGVLAATLLYTGPALDLLAEARPYGLLLGFGCLSLLGWQKARNHHRFAVALLMLGAFGMLLSHVFSIFLWTALAMAEAIRILRSRRIEWSLVLAWTVPLVCLATYFPLLHTHGAGIFPVAFQPKFHTIFSFYNSSIGTEATSLLLTALGMLMLVGRRSLRGGTDWILSDAEWTAAIFMVGIPVVILAQLIRSHAAFFPRYGLSGNIGISVLTAIFLAWWTRCDPRAALICIVVALFTAGELHFTIDTFLHRPILKATEPISPPCEACARARELDPSIPFVDASGLTFLEMDHRENASMLRNVFYLTDPVASTQYAHANIFEAMALEKSLFPIRANVSSYSEFIRILRHFFVIGDYSYPEDWLLRKLQADGATLRMLGQTTNSYKDKDLYDVSFPSS